ncbi:LytR/AlgR family response regulator transcription factor [Endozoicomonas numazuensis]|uniref:Chemotaxis protein CheY n=1 Tax=Endozoicomonas numazuensis TaxID=1137799 RepID=A0A081NIN8_9GAMM|nr:LytTR family DNA-binding domain-containing protein [Endozoicomonas numazuensis]KEQ18311.1 chemotaxis protein CheY [Endozoicomonas numazuensis]
MNILITDDEPLARDRLRHLLGRLEGFQALEYDAGNGIEALELCRKYQPDIVLMDIRMPVMGGLEAAAHISKLERPPAVIFCTAYDTHAIEAFQVQAVGYLLKPVKLEDLQQALSGAAKVNRLQLASLRDELNDNSRSHIAAKTLKGIELVPLDDISYFMADSKYVTVYHKNGEVLIDDPLKDLESEFNSRFVRIHRNALVARKAIERMTRDEQGHYFIQLSGVEEPLSVSRRHVPLMKKFMQSL